MTEKQLRKELEKIFDDFVSALDLMEQQFRATMAKKANTLLQKNVYMDSDLLNLPQEIFQLGLSFSSISWDVYLKNSSNKKAKQYYEDTLKSFADAGKAIAKNSPQDLGVRYESYVINEINKMIGGGRSTASNVKLFDVMAAGNPQATGILGKYGDMLFPGVNTYIDFKYSTHMVQMIVGAHGESKENIIDLEDMGKVDSPDILAEKIIQEIYSGVYSSLSHTKRSEQWLEPALHALESGISIEEAAHSSMKAMRYHKILIYIFKNQGMWSSQVVQYLKKPIIERAIKIYNDEGIRRIEESMSGDTYARDLFPEAYPKRTIWRGRFK